MGDDSGCGIAFVILIGCVGLSLYCGSFVGGSIVRGQAVERGYAEWVADKHGFTEFVWKSKPTEESEK